MAAMPGGAPASLSLLGNPSASARSSETTLGATAAGVPAVRGASLAERCEVGRSATRGIGSQELGT